MQSINDLNAFVSCRTATTSTADGSTFLRIVAVFEDLRTRTLLRTTIDQLKNHLNSESVVDSNFWKFEVLDSKPLRTIASQEGAEADILMVAARAEYDLPDSLQAWLKASLMNRRAAPLAFVALLCPDELGASVAPSVRTYLEEVAKKGRTEFFVNDSDEPDCETPGLLTRHVFDNVARPVWNREPSLAGLR